MRLYGLIEATNVSYFDNRVHRSPVDREGHDQSARIRKLIETLADCTSYKTGFLATIPWLFSWCDEDIAANHGGEYPIQQEEHADLICTSMINLMHRNCSRS